MSPPAPQTARPQKRTYSRILINQASLRFNLLCGQVLVRPLQSVDIRLFMSSMTASHNMQLSILLQRYCIMYSLCKTTKNGYMMVRVRHPSRRSATVNEDISRVQVEGNQLRMTEHVPSATYHTTISAMPRRAKELPN